MESTKTTVKEKKPREKTDKPYKKEGEKQNRQNRMQPRFLVSGEVIIIRMDHNDVVSFLCNK